MKTNGNKLLELLKEWAVEYEKTEHGITHKDAVALRLYAGYRSFTFTASVEPKKELLTRVPDMIFTSYCPKHKRPKKQNQTGFRCICAELEIAWILGNGESRIRAEPAALTPPVEAAPKPCNPGDEGHQMDLCPKCRPVLPPLCDECGGAGEIQVKCRNGDACSRKKEPHFQRCPKCQPAPKPEPIGWQCKKHGTFGLPPLKCARCLLELKKGSACCDYPIDANGVCTNCSQPAPGGTRP